MSADFRPFRTPILNNTGTDFDGYQTANGPGMLAALTTVPRAATCARVQMPSGFLFSLAEQDTGGIGASAFLVRATDYVIELTNLEQIRGFYFASADPLRVQYFTGRIGSSR